MNKFLKDQQRFEEILRTLKGAQREAVEQIEGPVLVIAGRARAKRNLLRRVLATY